MTLERDWILRRAVELGASDLLITAGHPVLITVAGKLQPMPESERLTPEDTRRLGESLITSAQRDRFERELELDTRFHLHDVGYFRVNLYVQRGKWGAALRIVPLRIPLPAEIGLAPHVVQGILGLTHGLVLVTGPTGAGRSTTLTAAETGNLVISTMATQSASQTVTRIIDSFPAQQQPQIRTQLALTLRTVVSQLLLVRADGRGRVAAREIMFVNAAIQNLIRED